MWKLLTRHKSKADIELSQLETQIHSAIIRHFENNKEILFKLPFEDYFDLLIEYGDALSTMGKSKKYIVVADELIYYIFEKNISEHKGIDQLLVTLFKKALAHYHLHQYDESVHVMRELLKMDPHNTAYKRIYRQCLYKLSINGDTHLSRGVFLVLVFTYAIMIGIELLIINPGFSAIAGTFEWIRWSVFIMALSIFIIGESRHHLMTWLRLNRDVREFDEIKQVKRVNVKSREKTKKHIV